MGFPPSEARKMSSWQYMAALDGFAAANDPEGDKRLTATEHSELSDWILNG